MKTETITTPDFTGRLAKIIADIHYQICVYKIDAKVIEDILQAEINEQCSKSYDAGHSDGYDDGYENGYADCNAKNHY